MNFKNIFNKAQQIAEGHSNEVKSNLGFIEEDEEIIFSMREKICNTCPLKDGNRCDSSKFINPKTHEVVSALEEGFVRGCGCRLSAKQKSKSAQCPANFWGGEF